MNISRGLYHERYTWRKSPGGTPGDRPVDGEPRRPLTTPSDMAMWKLSTLVFFAYAAAVACVLPGLARERRVRAVAAAALGLVITYAAGRVPLYPVFHLWVLPLAPLLIAYWTSGLLFVAPMPRVEQILSSFDDRLRIRWLAARTPHWLAQFLELAYTGVYPLIPVALGIHMTLTHDANPDRFWTVILTTDYICFAMLPWIQTRPPRALEPGEPWRASFRTFNFRILHRASIGVNTFPSGHAAEAVAAALLVADAPPAIAVWMAFNALAISAGAVLGRYHYAADALAGAAVAAAVWFVV